MKFLKDLWNKFQELSVFWKLLAAPVLVVYLLVQFTCLLVLTPLILLVSLFFGKGDSYKSRMKNNYKKASDLITEVFASGGAS